MQKCWSVVERFLTYGFCATYVPFVEHNGYFCTDLRLPYWGDIFLQPGKLSDEDCNYIFMRSWWQTKDIEALIQSQRKLSEKKRTWDIEALKRVKEYVTSKDDKAATAVEREKNINAKGGVELITGFQRGKKAKFYTFHVSSGEIVRVKENKDPRGEIPIPFAYGDIDGSNPFGRSIIDLVGSLQNLMDSEMQMYQYNRALQLNPPLIKRGNFSKNKIKFVPNIIIDVGTTPDATVEPLKIDTTAIANFPNNYGLMKSQMLNLLASPDTSISAEVGNPGFSKTPQGVEASRANLSVDDNYVRKQFETWFERWSETAINLYFAEREGIEELQLDKKTADELRKLAAEEKFDPTLLTDDNRIRINYSTATERLKFEVDASTSKMADEVQELQSLQGLSQLLDKSQFLQGVVPPNKQMELWNAIVRNSGAEDPENLIITDEEMQAAIEKLNQPRDDTREYLNVSYKDAPEDMKRQIEQRLGFQPSQMKSPVQQQADAKLLQAMQPKSGQQTEQMSPASAQSTAQPPSPPQLTAQDQEVISQLKQLGANDQIIGQALAMLHAGIPAQEIIKMVIQTLQGGQMA